MLALRFYLNSGALNLNVKIISFKHRILNIQNPIGHGQQLTTTMKSI